MHNIHETDRDNSDRPVNYNSRPLSYGSRTTATAAGNVHYDNTARDARPETKEMRERSAQQMGEREKETNKKKRKKNKKQKTETETDERPRSPSTYATFDPGHSIWFWPRYVAWNKRGKHRY